MFNISANFEDTNKADHTLEWSYNIQSSFINYQKSKKKVFSYFLIGTPCTVNIYINMYTAFYKKEGFRIK